MNSSGTEDLIGLLRSQDFPVRTETKPAYRHSNTRNVNTYNIDMHRYWCEEQFKGQSLRHTMGRVKVKSVKSPASRRTGQPYDWDLWWTK